MGLEDTWGSGVASGVGYDLQGLSVKAISGLYEGPELALVIALRPVHGPKIRLKVEHLPISEVEIPFQIPAHFSLHLIDFL